MQVIQSSILSSIMLQRTEHYVSMGELIHLAFMTEVSKHGTFDESKFCDNMEYAAKDVVLRISGVSYEGDKFVAYTAPPEDEWVVRMDIIDKMHQFL